MVVQRITKQFTLMLASAGALARDTDADALLVLLDGATDWQKLKQAVPDSVKQIIVAADTEADLQGATQEGLIPIALNKEKSPLLLITISVKVSAVCAVCILTAVPMAPGQRIRFASYTCVPLKMEIPLL